MTQPSPTVAPPLPKISIVTPNYNYAPFLEATLKSVLDQGYPNLEYIVLDDGSTDQSMSIIERYADRLAVTRTGKNKGQYRTITEGLNLATGEIMGWINSDDMHMPWTLKAVAGIFATFPDVQWISTLLPAHWDYEGICFEVFEYPGFSREAFLDGVYAIPARSIQQESTFWRRSLWEAAGSHVSHELGPAGDFDLWARFYDHADLLGVSAPLAGFRFQNTQQTSNMKRYVEWTMKSLDAARQRAGWKGKRVGRGNAAMRLQSVPKLRGWMTQKFGYTGRRTFRIDVGTPNPKWAPIIDYRFL